MRLFLSLFLCAASTPATPQDDAVRELAAIADAWDKAIVRKDLAGIEANMAPDFLQIRGNGKVVGREEFIRGIMDPALRLDPYAVEDFSVRLLGDAALLYGRIRMKGTSSGEPFEDHFRYIDAYAKRGGKWQIVSVQITLMAPEENKQGAQ
jgi:ketosteroid isomerase-like protein